jgi:hypothetical protein
MTYRISRILLQLAMEDGAQQAAKREISRQVREQSAPPDTMCAMREMRVGIEMLGGQLLVDSEEVEWVD